MTLTSTAVFLLTAAFVALWIWRSAAFKLVHFAAVSLFWVALAATPWGSDLIDLLQGALTSTTQAASGIVNGVSK
ncbi:hypothetical protein ACOKM3_14190 [Streptomyces sp. BH106]|uniref:hypothetical protein n=1 Tax=Streptomyces sp. BH106 TaxID=3410409 RepID=UPI003CF8B147